MGEIHVAAVARKRLRKGDLVQVRLPVAVAEDDLLVLHVTTEAEPVVHATTPRYLGIHSPRTGLRQDDRDAEGGPA